MATELRCASADFEKDKALLDKHIAEQQPDILKLTLEEEGWGSRPMIPLMPVDLLEKITRYYNQHGIRTTVHVSSELRSLEAIYAGSDTLGASGHPRAGERLVRQADGGQKDTLRQHADDRRELQPSG